MQNCMIRVSEICQIWSIIHSKTKRPMTCFHFIIPLVPPCQQGYLQGRGTSINLWIWRAHSVLFFQQLKFLVAHEHPTMEATNSDEHRHSPSSLSSISLSDFRLRLRLSPVPASPCALAQIFAALHLLCIYDFLSWFNFGFLSSLCASFETLRVQFEAISRSFEAVLLRFRCCGAHFCWTLRRIIFVSGGD